MPTPQSLLRRVFPPMLATLADSPPAGTNWAYELKYDGFRAVAAIVDGNIALWSRNELDLAPRFPAVADFYYREVVSRGLAGMRAMIELGIARGEIQNKNLARFPQILVAPALIAVIWQSLFSKHAPLDSIEMFKVHLDLVFGERRTT